MTLVPNKTQKKCFIDCGLENCSCKNREADLDPILKAQAEYEASCNTYIKLFCLKHDIDFDFWVSDIPGSVAFFGDYSFCFTDIVWDINSDQPKEKIFEWFEFYLENTHGAINYYMYTKL